MRKIAFLDIDDVLLTARAHALPLNAARIERMASGLSFGLDLLDALPIEFDPCAVAWFNRLIKLTEAKVVVHSSWRAQFTPDEIRSHLVSQGIDPATLHADLCCPGGPMSSKAEDIQAWLQEHPEVTKWVCLDDEARVGKGLLELGLLSCSPNGRPQDKDAVGCLVQIDARTGLGPKEYREALKHFELSDCLPMRGAPV